MSIAASRERRRPGWAPITARPLGPRPRGLHALLLALFLVTQVTALAHELEHVFHQHDAPCALHVVAEHLALVAPADPTPAVERAPVTGVAPLPLLVVAGRPARPSGARAPPRLS
jgi:hypothetical protein